MTNATTTTKTSQFRTILQNITCSRYADRGAVLSAIDTAFQAGQLTTREQRRLEAMVGSDATWTMMTRYLAVG